MKAENEILKMKLAMKEARERKLEAQLAEAVCSSF